MTTDRIVIEQPVINSAFAEPSRHFQFGEDGITNEIVPGRRRSSYFIPIARPKAKGKQLLLQHAEWTEDRLQENVFINRVRERVALWRRGGYQGVTRTTARLLDYWQRPERERRLFFCQLEAVETIIYLTEAAGRFGDQWIEQELRDQNAGANPLLYRLAAKMATGTGKTVVMGMLIAWQALNKFANRQDRHFTDAFLIVTPGITIRDRLRVLLPSEPENYYRQLDLLPPELLTDLQQAKIIITNYHAFLPREQTDGSALTKKILARGEASPFTETPDQMVRRVCRAFGNKRNIIVINDEAHHCYRRRPDIVPDEPRLTGEERVEAKKRDEEARVWISGLEAVQAKLGIRAVYDLSATPFFLRGSGYPEGTLFPWVVSDFSLIDAIESGLVKVPRVPVADDAMLADDPTYRTLWPRVREHLPKRGRGTAAVGGEPHLPVELEGALHSLYGHYERAYRQWAADTGAQARGQTPPVFIVVCNNTNVSKLVFDYVSGWEKTLPDGAALVVPGKLPIFSNERDGRWAARPNTILVDSEQLESGEALSADFKQIAAAEIAEFQADYRRRYPGRSADDITDADLLREVMNTVGKPGKLGEQVKCVVSVSMLTEGWDANTVTHILGVRAFGTQLLCEQVVGRALRRMSYAPNDDDCFEPEYADVYGVPFSFIPANGAIGPPKPRLMPTRVRALPERIAHELTFPRLLGYRFDLADQPLTANFADAGAHFAISTRDVPTQVQVDPIVGQGSVHTLADLHQRREQEVAFALARRTLEDKFRDDDGNVKHWYFPQLLDLARRWLRECVTFKDGTFPQLLLLVEFTHTAAEKLYHAIVEAHEQDKTLLPILRPYDTEGSTRYVDFDTTRPVYTTAPDRCHISHVVADTQSWEQKLAQVLEDLDPVTSYAKNQGLGFTIPYVYEGQERQYTPDFLVRARNGQGDPVNLILEVSGEAREDKAAKTATARTFWAPAVNNHGGYGRWQFLEITDPWDARDTILASLQAG
ncbi:MAG: BPTD_3080 family restriction endonuclease [Thermomicrobiales bacterium]